MLIGVYTDESVSRVELLCSEVRDLARVKHRYLVVYTNPSLALTSST